VRHWLLVLCAAAACGAPTAALVTPPPPPPPAIVDAAVEPAPSVAVVDAAPEAAVEPVDAGAATEVDASLDCRLTVLPFAAPTHATACASDDECAVVSNKCCPSCGVVPIPELRAVASKHAGVFCPQPTGCPRCMSRPPHDVFASCLRGTCVLAQRTCTRSGCPEPRPPRVLPAVMPARVASCKTNEECVLRTLECCWCGVLADANVRAMHKDVPFQCKMAGGCPDCVAAPNPDFSAVCVGGICRVKDEPPPCHR
jgi:hypothetical protein